MKIAIGSQNNPKVNALKEIAKDYDFLSNAEVVAKAVDSGVAEQPMTMEDTIKGAMNRAKSAFQDCELSFGIEDGLMPVPFTKTGYMNLCVCAIFDGKEFHIGFGSSYEYPLVIMDLVLNKGKDISEAYKEAGFTEHEKIGEAKGAISVLTKERLIRKDYAKQAIMMALIHLDK